MSRPTVLTVAGVDSSGGAGVAADLKTFEAHGLWGSCAVTAVTAQSAAAVDGVWPLPPEAVVAQVEAVVRAGPVAAAKTGMLATAEIVRAMVEVAPSPLVVDPVLVSSSGAVLLADASSLADLVARATVVTPNLAEAAALTGLEVGDRPSMVAAARALLELGAHVVMVTGGHVADDGAAADVVVGPDGEPVWLEGPRLETPHTHGTGCVLSAALAAELARGMEPVDACVAAKQFTARAIAAGAGGAVDPGWERRGQGT